MLQVFLYLLSTDYFFTCISLLEYNIYIYIYYLLTTSTCTSLQEYSIYMFIRSSRRQVSSSPSTVTTSAPVSCRDSLVVEVVVKGQGGPRTTTNKTGSLVGGCGG